jgi:hypothetical protein
MSDFESNDEAIVHRALTATENATRHAPPLALAIFKALICALLIIGAACAEVFTATVGFRAAFPTLSDGTSLAEAIMPMRYAIAAYMLLGHVVLRSIADRFGSRITWLLDSIGLLAIILMLLGMSVFQFTGTYGVTGSPDDHGNVSSLTGPALGTLCGSLFTVSFLGAHWAAGKLVKELPNIAASCRTRQVIADHARAIEDVLAAQSRIATRAAVIDDMAKPDALNKRAAVEAAHEVGMVTARAHELLSQRRLHGDVDLTDDDDVPMRDVPVAALEQRYEALARYDFAHFFNLLRKDNGHA